MFTGIIKEVGRIKNVRKVNMALEIEVGARKIASELCQGDSIAVNGCCLTVKEFNRLGFKADISFSTLKSTTFNSLKAGDPVNLEDAVSLKDRLGGHIVTGHIDDVGKMTEIKRIGDFYKVTVKIPQNLLVFTAPKGSFSIDGISLTIADVTKNRVDFAIIPFTFENTSLRFKKRDDLVNLEVDLMARYIINMAKYSDSSEISSERKKTLSTLQTADYVKTSDNNNIKNISKERDEKLEAKLKKYGFK